MPDQAEQRVPTLFGEPVGKDRHRTGMIWAWERFPRLVELGMGRTERDVLVAIMSYTRIDGGVEAWPSQSSIADQCGWVKSEVNKALNNLEQSQAISRDKRPGGLSTLYTIRPEVDGHQWVSVERTSPQDGLVCIADYGSPQDGLDSPHSGQGVVCIADYGSPQDGHEHVYITSGLERSEETGGRQQPGGGGLSASPGESVEQVNSAKTGKPKQRGRLVNLPPAQTQVILGKAPVQTPKPGPTGPEHELATWYYALIGKPPREAASAKTTWPGVFRRLIDSRNDGDPVGLIKGAAEFAKDHRYWGTQLARFSGCSATFYLEKFPEILSQRTNDAARAAKRGQAGHAKPSISSCSAVTELDLSTL